MSEGLKNMPPLLNKSQFLRALERDISVSGNQTLYAAKIGFSDATVSSVLHSRREPSGRFLGAAGYDCFPRYRLATDRDAPLLNSLEFFTNLKILIRVCGGLKRFCVRHGLNEGSVSNALSANRRVHDALVSAVGYVCLTRYRRRCDVRRIAA